MLVGVIGAGTMGAGIAQVIAQNGDDVILVDLNKDILEKAKQGHEKIFNRLVEKGNLSAEECSNLLQKISYQQNFSPLSDASLIIEAIVENLDVKKKVFEELEGIVPENCILASNTSSLSIASIGSCLKHSGRVIGLHFFNPAPLMPLVEIIPAVQTNQETISKCTEWVNNWKKTGVLCKDTPGFIVNRVARPFYGEALRIYEEGIADFATIDWAMTALGGFKMGPFTLMDYIGNDVNYTVTETVFTSFYFDPRFKPSFTQKRHKEAGFYGRKSGRGFYNYAEDAPTVEPNQDNELGRYIFERILVMLINEAADAVFMNVATEKDVDLAMTKGVNYPKGLLQWANEFGIENVYAKLVELFEEYGEDRYRPNPLLKKMARNGSLFNLA
jgi:3-hydroxybutyryl-CoA dehydrogenase